MKKSSFDIQTNKLNNKRGNNGARRKIIFETSQDKSTHTLGRGTLHASGASHTDMPKISSIAEQPTRDEATRRSLQSIPHLESIQANSNSIQVTMTPYALRSTAHINPSTSSMTTLELRGTQSHQQTKFLTSLNCETQQHSPRQSVKNANIGAAQYKEYLKSHKNSMPISRPTESMLTNNVAGSTAAKNISSVTNSSVLAGKLRLKPSQILEDAKRDVQFGGYKPTAEQMKRGASSLAVLSGYLQPSASQQMLEQISNPNIHSTPQVLPQHQNPISGQRRSIQAVIDEKFIFKEQSRFKENNLRLKSSLEGSIVNSGGSQLDENPLTIGQSQSQARILLFDQVSPKQESNSQLPIFQSIKNHQNQKKAQHSRFQSPVPPQSQLNIQSQQQSIMSSAAVSKSRPSNVFNAHSSIMSVNSQNSQNQERQSQQQPVPKFSKPPKILGKNDTGANAPQVYIAHLSKQTPTYSQSHSLKEELAKQLNNHQKVKSRIQKIQGRGSNIEIRSNDELAAYPGVYERADSGSVDNNRGEYPMRNQQTESQMHIPYQVTLMSVSQSQKLLPQMQHSMDHLTEGAAANFKPNKVRMKQEKIMNKITTNHKRDGQSTSSKVLKSRNPSGLKTQENRQQQADKQTLQNRRYASAIQSKSPSRSPSNQNNYDLDDILNRHNRNGSREMEPVEQVKLLPLKARKIFKKAMKELDQIDLVNSSQLPLSRPRIRAILRKMKDSLDTGTVDDQTPNQNLLKLKREESAKRLLMDGIGRQAERELFGMLIKEKELRKDKEMRNAEMKKLYDERVQRKRMQYESLQKKQERRLKLLQNNSYVSNSSSDSMSNSYEVDQQIDAYGNIIQTDRYHEGHHNLLSSDRPSSANSDLLNPGSVTSRKDQDRYNKMLEASDRKKRKQEKIILEELLQLMDGPMPSKQPKAGNFYSKFQNIDKIIQQENNDRALTSLHNKAEQQDETNDELRQLQIHQNQQKVEQILAKPFKQRTFEPGTLYDQASKSPTRPDRSPSKDTKQRNIQLLSGKSPIVEYLKQVQKDKLLPHFMPFKKLQESTSQNGGQGLKYNLDSFSINVRVAPSIASAVRNLQQLKCLSLIDTMMSEEAFMTIIDATPQSLTSLNLSQNEHLTPKCFSALHKFANLAHLTLEKCNIGDETIFLLLDLDPYKLNQAALKEQELNKSEKKNRRLRLSKSLSSFGTTIMNGNNNADDDQLEDEFIFSGLIKSLQLFNVSKNKVSDAGAKVISTFIEKSEILETLQLHWNKIRAKGAMLLAKAIKKNRTIKILDLSFNSFGSGAIRKAVISDDIRKEEEVAQPQRHAIDKFECSQSAWKWRKTLMKNLTLLHVDISFNGFSAEDMIAIGDGLRENHSLFGCHIEGNNARMDALGFVYPMITDKTTKQNRRGTVETYDVHNYDRIPITMENVHLEMDIYKMSSRQHNSQMFAAGPQSGTDMPGLTKTTPRNCWLCEGWQQQKFEIRLPDKFIGCEVASVYIHLSYEEFKPMVMQEKIEDDDDQIVGGNRDNTPLRFTGGRSKKTINIKSGETSIKKTKSKTPQRNSATIDEGDFKRANAQLFQLFRMVPPSKEGIQYYFSLQNPKNFKKETFIDPYMKKIFVEENFGQQPQADSERASDSGEPMLAFPKFVNSTRPIKPKVLPMTPQDRMELKAKPRCAFNTQELTRPKSAWSIPKSFFGRYKFDNDAIIAKCFDWDWQCSTLDKMIKDPQEKEAVVKYLRPKYGLIRETYKHLACVAPAGTMPSMGMNVLTELMLKCNDFVDYKSTKLSDVDLAFIATNAVGAKHYPFRLEVCINPERQIIRYQFFEILMRLAIERFTQKLKMPVVEGIKIFYESYLQDTFMKYNSHPWREDKYWNEECDTVIVENMHTLIDIYNSFARAQSPGDPKVLRIGMLIELVTQSGVCDDNFGAREIGPLFNLAKQTSMDEINQTKHMDMTFIEFVEALARIADKAVNHSTVEFPIDRDRREGTPTNNNKSLQKSLTKKTTLRPSNTVLMDSVNESPDQFRNPTTPVAQKRQQADKKSDLSPFSDKSRDDLTMNKSLIVPHEVINKTLDSVREDNGIKDFNLDLRQDLAHNTRDNKNFPLVSIITDSYEGKDQVKEQLSSALPLQNLPQKLNKSSLRKSELPSKRGGQRLQSATGSSNRGGARQSSMPSKASEAISNYDSQSIANISAYEGELSLPEKMQKYINRIACTCMGQQYSHKYRAQWSKRNKKNAKKILDADADLVAQAELLGQIGYSSTLKKLRYADQKPPATPKDKKRGMMKSVSRK